LAVRKKEKGKQETGIVIHSWKQSNQQKPLVKIQSAQVVKIQSAPTDSSQKRKFKIIHTVRMTIFAVFRKL